MPANTPVSLGQAAAAPAAAVLHTIADPIQLVRQLDANVIRSRLDEMDRERAALVILYRAALRAERPGSAVAQQGGAAHAR